MKVIVLPGLDGTGALLAPFCDALPRGLEGEVLCYPADLIAYDDILAWLTLHWPQGDFVVVAESFSGPLAMRLASDPPPGLRAVICVATFARCPRWIPRLVLQIGQFWPFGTGIVAWGSLPFTMGRWRGEMQEREFIRALRGVPLKTLLGRLEAVRTVDVRDLVPLVPTHYIRAQHDWLVPKRAAFCFSDVTEIAGPHFLLQTRPMQAVGVIVDFLQSILSVNMRDKR